MSVDVGAGDDTVVIGSALVAATATAAGDVLEGGAGTDTLSMATAVAQAQTTAFTGLSGFEAVTISDAIQNSQTIANFGAGLTTVNIAGANADDSGALVMEAGAVTLNVSASLAGTLTVTDTGTATTDTLTLTNSAAAADDMFDGESVAINGYETVNIVTTNVGATEAQDMGALTVTADTGGTATVSVSGTNIINVDGVVTADALSFAGMTAQAAGTATADMTGQAFEYAGASGSGTLTVLRR